MARTRKKIGEILQSWGVVTSEGVNKAVELAKMSGVRTGEALVQLELCSDEDVSKALGKLPVGERVPFTVVRGTETKEIAVRLGEGL